MTDMAKAQHHRPGRGRARRWAALLAALGGVVGALSPVGTEPAGAVDLTTAFSTMLWSGQPAWIYVEEGETFSFFSQARSASYTITASDGTPQVLTATSAGGATSTGTSCTAGGGGASCAFEGVATQTGVWRVTTGGAAPFNATSTYLQQLDVRGPDGELRPGRVWFDRLDGNQHVNGVGDVAFWLLSPTGTRYHVLLDEYRGYGSSLAINSKGVLEAGTCRSAYRSVPLVGGQQAEPEGGLVAADYTLDASACPDTVWYRIFPEAPDPSMPAEVAAWADGRTANRWLYADHQAMALTPPTLVRSGTATAAGTITTVLSGQPGQVTALVDVDGDGSFDGPRDRAIGPVAAGLGTVSIPWDGLDGQGDPVPATADLRLRVEATGDGEVHLVLTDAEGLGSGTAPETLTGGLTLTRLTGDGAPSTLASWDDSYLLPRATDRVPPQLAATDADTSAVRRGWLRATSGAAGWGDSRHMDTWATMSRAAESEAAAPGAALAASVTKAVDTPDPVTPGAVLGYTVTVTNDGQADATAADPLVVTDVIADPTDVAEVTVTATSTGTAVVTGTGLTWTIDDLAVGATATLRYQVRLATDAAGSIVNRAAADPEADCPTAACAETVTPIDEPEPTTTTTEPTTDSTVPPTPTTGTPTPEPETPGTHPGALARTGGGTTGALLGLLLVAVGAVVSRSARRVRRA